MFWTDSDWCWLVGANVRSQMELHPPVPEEPTTFAAFPEVVDWLRERTRLDKKPQARKMYRVWAAMNESSIRCLARLHHLGLDFLELGLRGAIEKMHIDALAATRPDTGSNGSKRSNGGNDSNTPYAVEAKVVAQVAISPQGDEEHLAVSSVRKRPRRLAEAVVDPAARRRSRASNLHSVLDDTWNGKFVTVRKRVCEKDVLSGILDGDAFSAGYCEEAGCFFAGRMHAIPPECRPAGAANASDELDDLFDELLTLSKTLAVSGSSARHGIRVIGGGTYNLVVHPSDSSKLPKCLIGADVALRFPRPWDEDGPPKVCVVATELSNILEAACGDFGPAVKGAIAQVWEGSEKTAQLLIAMERLDRTLYSAVLFLNAKDVPSPHRIARLLRDTVCKFSTMQFLFLDASPNNFLLRGSPDDCSDVCVCDLDPQLFRRTEQSVSTCLLFNLLMVGAHLKKYGSVEFFNIWRDLPTGPSTLRDFVRALPRDGISNVLWAETFRVWKPQQVPNDDTIQEDLLGVVFHYFVSSAAICLHKELSHSDGPNSRRRRLLTERVLPTMLFFGSRIGWPRQLADVFLEFWDCRIAPVALTSAEQFEPVLRTVRRIDASRRE